MEKQIKIALAGNPNSGKTTLFNALTGSNQFVGNWPGVTVEKKEGRLKKHEDVVIMDLPGIYSLSPYTLEEVVARNYLIGQRPDAILNIIDGTNLERNLYLTTQLTELGIPVVVAINMMDVVRKNGDQINVAELSRELGCKVVEISALKGDGVMEAAQAAVEAAATAKTVPMHTFSGPVEHAIAHIEEAAVHDLPEEQQRWYAIKIFERDDKVLEQLKIDPTVMTHIEADIKAAEKELDDDAESIITNERYVYIAQLIKGCYKQKKAKGELSASDKIDRVVTNRWLGLPIFALVMFLVYWIAMVAVGAPATDWANDGVFGDGWHLLGIDGGYNEVADTYGEASLIVDGYEAYIEEHGALAADGTFTYDVEDEETLAVTTETATLADYEAAKATLAEIGDEPDPADYGVWVPGIPVLIGDALDAAGTPDWLNGLILDGIVAGVGAVLGFVPQMLVLFLMLAFLEACGYMARIAFVLDRVFRKFGLSGKSFIPMLIGVGCGVRLGKRRCRRAQKPRRYGQRLLLGRRLRLGLRGILRRLRPPATAARLRRLALALGLRPGALGLCLLGLRLARTSAATRGLLLRLGGVALRRLAVGLVRGLLLLALRGRLLCGAPPRRALGLLALRRLRGLLRVGRRLDVPLRGLLRDAPATPRLLLDGLCRRLALLRHGHAGGLVVFLH